MEKLKIQKYIKKLTNKSINPEQAKIYSEKINYWYKQHAGAIEIINIPLADLTNNIVGIAKQKNKYGWFPKVAYFNPSFLKLSDELQIYSFRASGWNEYEINKNKNILQTECTIPTSQKK